MRLFYDFGLKKSSYFDVNNRSCDLVAPHGLTCSTFVAVIFQSVRRPLIDLRGWKMRPDDGVAYQQLVAEFDAGVDGVSHEHAQVLRRHSSRKRVSPIDVASAAIEDRLPANQRACNMNSFIIYESLIRAYCKYKGWWPTGIPIHLAPFNSMTRPSFGGGWFIKIALAAIVGLVIVLGLRLL